jgi:hypothetical protein
VRIDRSIIGHRLTEVKMRGGWPVGERPKGESRLRGGRWERDPRREETQGWSDNQVKSRTIQEMFKDEILDKT